MKKRFLALSLALVLVLGLTACGGGGGTSSSAPAPSSQAPASSEPASSEPPASSEEPAPALDFPQKDITLVNPYEAGGTSDIPARIFADHISKNMDGKYMNVTCIAGSGGALGAQEVMRANPDGYTLLVAPAGYAMQYAKGTADFTYEDFDPVCLFVTSYLSLAVKADSPYETYEDLVAAAKERPGELKFGVATGALPMFCVLAMEDQEDIKFNIVDIGGTTLKAPELLSGRVDVIIESLAGCKPFLESEEFRILGLYAENRFPEYADVPTFKELGYDTNVMNQVFGVWAPKGTPREVIDYIADKFQAAAEDPAIMQSLNDLTYSATYIPTDDYIQELAAMYEDFVEFAKLLK